ncbi:MAG: M48 family metalloprotease [Solirubrobacteraceae bacterium]
MTVTIGVVLVLGIALPHMWSMERVAPPIAVAVWVAALALRAVTGVLVLMLVVFYLPATQLFDRLTHWCWHAVIPFLAERVGLSGHSVGDAATVLAAIALPASVLSVGWAVTRAARGVRQLLREQALGRGPMGSVIVGGPSVVIAAAGLRRPKVVVSAGTLTQLDDAELAACLDHEGGHIARRHRLLVLFGELCRALGRFIPGTRSASAELAFHLERDADAYALARQHDPLALASAICKAALATSTEATHTPVDAGRSVAGRVRLLCEDAPDPRRRLDRALGLAAAATVALTLWLALAAPSVAAPGARGLKTTPAGHSCSS